MTTLEAMSCGLPVIVPTIGGIAELVNDSENGYKIDVQDFDMIKRRIAEMMANQGLYTRLSANALLESQKHSASCMLDAIQMLVN